MRSDFKKLVQHIFTDKNFGTIVFFGGMHISTNQNFDVLLDDFLTALSYPWKFYFLMMKIYEMEGIEV